MAKEATLTKLLVPDDNKATEASDAHQRARKIVDLIFSYEPASPRRWRAIQRLWFELKPITRSREHRAAVYEAKEVASTLLDKKFGQSAATLNKGRVQETGKTVQHLRVLGLMPESLYGMLRRFDPLGLGIAKGQESQKMRVRLYNEFIEYKIPEHL